MGKEMLETNLSKEQWKEFFDGAEWKELKKILNTFVDDAKNDMVGETMDPSNPFVTMAGVYSIGGSIKALSQVLQLETILIWEESDD